MPAKRRKRSNPVYVALCFTGVFVHTFQFLQASHSQTTSTLTSMTEKNSPVSAGRPNKIQFPPSPAASTFQGELSIGAGMTLPLVFHFSTAQGIIEGTMDSPGQNAFGIKFDKVDLSPEGKLTASLDKMSARFEGQLDTSAQSLSGTWSQSGSSLPIKLSAVEKYVGPKRPQTRQPSFPYISANVTFHHCDITLAGTFTRPKNDKPNATVILLQGSGPHDRDETIFNHKPFLVIADYLSRHGIAVLRYDKRGCDQSGGDYRSSTSQDFVSDGMAALRYLQSRSDVDKSKIGLIGHSEGGVLAPAIASQTQDLNQAGASNAAPVAFIVLLAGSALPGDQILISQIKALNKNADSGADAEQALHIARETYKILKEEKDNTEAIKKIKAKRQRLKASEYESEEKLKKLGPVIDASLADISGPWYRYFLSYDPRPTLSKVRCPILAINGDKDMQVLVDENFAAIKSSLETGGNKDFELKKIAGVNHLFQKSQTGMPAEYATIEETISPDVLSLVCDWITKRTAK